MALDFDVSEAIEIGSWRLIKGKRSDFRFSEHGFKFFKLPFWINRFPVELVYIPLSVLKIIRNTSFQKWYSVN